MLNWSNAWTMHKLNTDGSFAAIYDSGSLGAIAASMVGSIFSSDAWNSVTFIAGEMKNPKRDVGLSLFFGTMIVTLIYVSANVMYTAVLPLHDIATADKDRVAVAASHVIFGQCGHHSDCIDDHDIHFWLQQRIDTGRCPGILHHGQRWLVL